MKYFFISLFFSLMIACHKNDVSNLEGDWTATSIKLGGTSQATSTTCKLNLKTDNQYTFTTNLTPFTHPTSGTWSVDANTTKLTLESNVWTIHHLSSSSLRIVGTVDGAELDMEFSK